MSCYVWLMKSNVTKLQHLIQYTNKQIFEQQVCFDAKKETILTLAANVMFGEF